MNTQDMITKIITANEEYRNGTPIIPDTEYDLLLTQLKENISKSEFEDFRLSLMEQSGDVTHSFVIGSLDKVKYGEDELSKWIKKHNIKKVFWSDKLDGMSFTAEYKHGVIASLTTRGDGITGQSLNSKMKYIQIPQNVVKDFSGTIRGELVLEGDSHVILGMKNKRNGVVGTMGRDEILVDVLSHVKAYAYQILTSSWTIDKQFKHLEGMKFNVPRHGFIEVAPNIEEDLKTILLEETNYDKDGIVISSDTYTNENVYYPEKQIAFKVNSEGIPTVINSLLWEVSKNRLIKPVAQIKPIDCDGATLSNVTCYNAKYVEENGIGSGTEILLVRSGGVIPKIVGIVSEVNPDLPLNCPNCGSEIKWYGVDLQCQNEDCSAATVKQVEHFIKELGIENASESSLRNWDIFTFTDLLSWKPDPKYKSQVVFYEALKQMMFSVSAKKLMRSFSFEGMGTTIFDRVLNEVHEGSLDSMDNMFNCGNYVKYLVKGIGERTLEKAEDDWEKNWETMKLITSHPSYNYIQTNEPKEKVMGNDILAGKSFVLTGKMSVPRSEKEELIKQHGGTIASGVTKNLTYLIAAAEESGTSKYVKAKNLNVSIITEEEFDRMLK